MMFASHFRVDVEGQIRVAEEFDFDDVTLCTDPARETADAGATAIYPDQPPALDEHNALFSDKSRLATLRVPEAQR